MSPLAFVAALFATSVMAGGAGAVLGLGGGILLAPSLVLGTRVLMQGPDHLGTAVPILLMLLVLDRAPERWWVPVVVAVLLPGAPPWLIVLPLLLRTYKLSRSLGCARSLSFTSRMT